MDLVLKAFKDASKEFDGAGSMAPRFAHVMASLPDSAVRRL
jgi:hypothetical protein